MSKKQIVFYSLPIEAGIGSKGLMYLLFSDLKAVSSLHFADVQHKLSKGKFACARHMWRKICSNPSPWLYTCAATWWSHGLPISGVLTWDCFEFLLWKLDRFFLHCVKKSLVNWGYFHIYFSIGNKLLLELGCLMGLLQGAKVKAKMHPAYSCCIFRK